MRILVTGSAGLVGAEVSRQLRAADHEVVGFDVRADLRDDVRDAERVAEAIEDVDGVIHLAGLSRVIWGENQPELCWQQNVGGTSNVLDAALRRPLSPWVIFSSSREIYGHPDTLPAVEDSPLKPCNIYGYTKLVCEKHVNEAVESGLRASIVRLSNVFGSPRDHDDRVVPAFAAAAAHGTRIRIDGRGHTFDFTHVVDVARGIVELAHLLSVELTPPPPIHFVTGEPTTLGELAALACRLGGTRPEIVDAAERHYDVSHFYGSPARAREVLGWRPTIPLAEGLAVLIEEYRAK